MAIKQCFYDHSKIKPIVTATAASHKSYEVCSLDSIFVC